MIDKHELRIGNKVKDCHGIITTINQLRNGSASLIHSSQHYDILQPIELTEDMLLKCGFERHGEWFVFQDWPIAINASITYNKVTIGHGEEYEVPIKYLHQLQNLTQTLTGKELQIDLK